MNSTERTTRETSVEASNSPKAPACSHLQIDSVEGSRHNVSLHLIHLFLSFQPCPPGRAKPLPFFAFADPAPRRRAAAAAVAALRVQRVQRVRPEAEAAADDGAAGAAGGAVAAGGHPAIVGDRKKRVLGGVGGRSGEIWGWIGLEGRRWHAWFQVEFRIM